MIIELTVEEQRAMRVGLMTAFRHERQMARGATTEEDRVRAERQAHGYILLVEKLAAAALNLDAELYQKCAECHLFVEPNPAFGDYPGLAEYTHLHRGEGADVALDESHEPRPSGEIHPLAWWMQHGPSAMRERFVR